LGYNKEAHLEKKRQKGNNKFTNNDLDPVSPFSRDERECISFTVMTQRLVHAFAKQGE
jgi:hypothetical protein